MTKTRFTLPTKSPPISDAPPSARVAAVLSAAQWWLQPSPLPVLAPASLPALSTLAARSETNDAAVAAAERVLLFCLRAEVQLPPLVAGGGFLDDSLDDHVCFEDFCDTALRSTVSITDPAACAARCVQICHGLRRHMRHEASVVAACTLLQEGLNVQPVPGVVHLLAAAAQAHPRSDAVQGVVLRCLVGCATGAGPAVREHVNVLELAAVGIHHHLTAAAAFMSASTSEDASLLLDLMGTTVFRNMAAAATHGVQPRCRRAAPVPPAPPRMSADELAAAAAAADAAAAALLAEEDAAASAAQRKKGKKKKHKQRGGAAAAETEEASGAAADASSSAEPVAPSVLSPPPSAAEDAAVLYAAAAVLSPPAAEDAPHASAACKPPLLPVSAPAPAPAPPSAPLLDASLHALAVPPMPPPAASAPTSQLSVRPCMPDAALPPLPPWLLDEPYGIAAPAAPASETSLAEQLRLMKLQHEQMCHEQAQMRRAQELLLQEQEREREAKLCVICLDAAKDAVLMPCFHVCVCAGCAAALAARPGGGLCPVCRARIASYQRVFV